MDLTKLQLKKFESAGSKFSRKISITRSSSFGFPLTFRTENNLTNLKYITLFYDESQKIVGIKFTKEPTEKESFKLSLHIGGGAAFGAHSFFKKYNINSSKVNGKYDYKKQNIEGIGEVFLINLKSASDLNDED